jgi:hypothetical protein
MIPRGFHLRTPYDKPIPHVDGMQGTRMSVHQVWATVQSEVTAADNSLQAAFLHTVWETHRECRCMESRGLCRSVKRGDRGRQSVLGAMFE